MNIQGEHYSVVYDVEAVVLKCSGSLDMRGKAGYKEIAELFDKVVHADPVLENIYLDVRELEFLNSSGITTLGGFIIKLRKRGVSRLFVQCSNKYAWQSRSMASLKKLMPDGLELSFE